ncbi:MAG: hypothetical protein MZU79_02380 [Anaerotruncus sp.]|nr:hypothetical protein [Anaerotruncus sp.]
MTVSSADGRRPRSCADRGLRRPPGRARAGCRQRINEGLAALGMKG